MPVKATKMFGFKKKKKNQLDGGITKAAALPPSVTERKSSKGSILSFGKKSQKAKTISSHGSMFYVSDILPPEVNWESNGTSNVPLPNKSRNSANEAVPGFKALGRLASDLEALQMRRQSQDTNLRDKNLEIKSDLDVSPTGESEERTSTLPEEWGEQEVLSWLRENDLQYFVDLFDGCGIDGDYLLQITEEDLVELEVDDEELRKKFLSAVNGLLNFSEEDVDISLPGFGDDGSGSDEWESLGEIDDDQEKASSSEIITAKNTSKKVQAQG